MFKRWWQRELLGPIGYNDMIELGPTDILHWPPEHLQNVVVGAANVEQLTTYLTHTTHVYGIRVDYDYRCPKLAQALATNQAWTRVLSVTTAVDPALLAALTHASFVTRLEVVSSSAYPSEEELERCSFALRTMLRTRAAPLDLYISASRLDMTFDTVHTSEPALAYWRCVTLLQCNNWAPIWGDVLGKPLQRLNVMLPSFWFEDPMRQTYNDSLCRFIQHNQVQHVQLCFAHFQQQWPAICKSGAPKLQTIEGWDTTTPTLVQAAAVSCPNLTSFSFALNEKQLEWLSQNPQKLCCLESITLTEFYNLDALLRVRPGIRKLKFEATGSFLGRDQKEFAQQCADLVHTILASSIRHLELGVDKEMMNWLPIVLRSPRCPLRVLTITSESRRLTETQRRTWRDALLANSSIQCLFIERSDPVEQRLDAWANTIAASEPVQPSWLVAPPCCIDRDPTPLFPPLLSAECTWAKQSIWDGKHLLDYYIAQRQRIYQRQIAYVLSRDSWQQLAMMLVWYQTLQAHPLASSVFAWMPMLRTMTGGGCTSLYGSLDIHSDKELEQQIDLLWSITNEAMSMEMFRQYPLSFCMEHFLTVDTMPIYVQRVLTFPRLKRAR